MMMNRGLLSAGARMMMGASRGEGSGMAIGAGINSAMDSTDQLLHQGLRTQMANRDYGLKKGMYDMETATNEANIKAAEDFLKSLGRPPTQQELMEANAIRNGQAGYVAGTRLRNSMFGGLGYGGYGTDPTGTPAPSSDKKESGDEGGSDYSWMRSAGDMASNAAGWAWDKSIDFLSGNVSQDTVNKVRETGEEIASNPTGNKYINPVLKTMGNLYDSAKGVVGNAATGIMDVATFANKYYSGEIPEPTFAGEGLTPDVKNRLYMGFAKGGKEYGQAYLASGVATPAEQQYIIDLMTYNQTAK